MSTSNFITYDELIEALERDTTDSHFIVAGNFLLDAINDWPTFNLKEPKDLINELKEGIKKPLTYDNLLEFEKNMDYKENNAWKQSTISILLELYDFERKNHYNNTIVLEEIIEKITSYFRNNK